jgi:hypothetical protein
MTNRNTFNGASVDVPWKNTGSQPEGFGDQYQRHIKNLYDNSALRLTGVGGTGNTITASLDPVLSAGLTDGMKFTTSWAAANTGAVTLAINGGAAVSVRDEAGAALVAGMLVAGTRSLIEYIGGQFRVLTGLADTSADPAQNWTFTSSGTWTKPSGLDPDTMVTVEAWGGGGGGTGVAGAAGGGGGGYATKRFRLGDLPSSLAVAIGAGGAVGGTTGTSGGNTTFGSLLTAYGGGAGSANGGGGGGGEGSAGLISTSGGSGGLGGGNGGGAGTNGNPGTYRTGGGGGGGSAGGAGGRSIMGGGGGAGSTGSAGVSVHGGNGGTSGAAGSAPGGGGGYTGAGARGELRIWI